MDRGGSPAPTTPSARSSKSIVLTFSHRTVRATSGTILTLLPRSRCGRQARPPSKRKKPPLGGACPRCRLIGGMTCRSQTSHQQRSSGLEHRLTLLALIAPVSARGHGPLMPQDSEASSIGCAKTRSAGSDLRCSARPVNIPPRSSQTAYRFRSASNTNSWTCSTASTVAILSSAECGRFSVCLGPLQYASAGTKPTESGPQPNDY